MRGVTDVGFDTVKAVLISTHTPHARRDPLPLRLQCSQYHFYSHASCEAWLCLISLILWQWDISTHTPHARRDTPSISIKFCKLISTHTPHARRDANSVIPNVSMWSFLLTRLMRGVTYRSIYNYRSILQFLLTRLMRGVTWTMPPTGQ